MFILYLIINIFTLIEFYNLSYKIKLLPYKLPGVIAGVFIFSISYMVAASIITGGFLILVLLVIPLIAIPPLFYDARTVFKSWGATLFGLAYISIPLSLLPFLAFAGGNYQFEILMGIFIIIWFYDTFAYITGVSLGRTRLFPSVSPKKSWEGAAGGTFFTIGAALLLSKLFGILTTGQWINLGIIVVITGTLGDLMESALKRNAGVKDSGELMPGHGGFLDRFDSFLFSVPFVFTYLYFIIL
jgi:phosphatidate cytidylyltransferase